MKKCSELMKTDVECCDGGALVEAVAEQMRSKNIGFVPVCDEKGVVIGTLTDRDLAIRVLAEHRSPAQTKAKDVMSTDVVSCKADDELLKAEELMSKHKKSRIVCVDDRKRPVGVISLSDLAQQETGGKASAILRSVSQREARA
ncbi:CBS domain-containing protein [Pendulispora albinea]|uniref:CBS domain-containing protein n=1 Tax=Pendulispora albinea TaxID=2741071 RepID=A0ABZ2LPR3_9BACT